MLRLRQQYFCAASVADITNRHYAGIQGTLITLRKRTPSISTTPIQLWQFLRVNAGFYWMNVAMVGITPGKL